MMAEHSLKDKKGHGHDGSDLHFKMRALVVCGGRARAIRPGGVWWNVRNIPKY